eukprot:6192499-Pleurochrysis_carterae.AAC.1
MRRANVIGVDQPQQTAHLANAFCAVAFTRRERHSRDLTDTRQLQGLSHGNCEMATAKGNSLHLKSLITMMLRSIHSKSMNVAIQEFAVNYGHTTS